MIMMRLNACVLAMLLGLSAPAAFAQGAPLNLTPPGQRPAPAAPAAAPAPAPATETPQQLIQKINASLNSSQQMIADFTQISSDGRRRNGKLYVLRPGKLRFDYNPPVQLEVVSDGSQVAVIDKKVPQQDVYAISQTPLKFLVGERIDVTRETKLLGVRRERDEVIVELEDKNTVAGTSKLRIHFSGDTFMIRRWTITDPQGIPTTVQLANISTQQRPNNNLFVINLQFNPARGNN
jgi:outer membrane lipoprotein-sorting protein